MRVIVVLAELSDSVREDAAEVRHVEHRATLSATSAQRSARSFAKCGIPYTESRRMSRVSRAGSADPSGHPSAVAVEFLRPC